jgi:tetratricopeptide (TPR) repeat protein
MERYEEAIAYFDKAIELDSGYTNTYLSKAIVQQMLGDYSGARETYRIGRIHSGKDENEPLWIMFQAQAHAAEGRRDEALTMLNRLLRSNSAEREEMKKLTFDIALVYNLLGERETACEWLGKIESKLIEDPKKLSRDPRLAALRESACFGKLIEKWQNERQARR